MMILRQEKPVLDPKIPEFDSILVDRILQVSFTGSSIFGHVGVVDIVDSTRIAATIGEAKLSSYYAVFLNSMAAIIRRHGGRIVKNVGDSLLYYFSANECSSCIDCGIAMLQSREKINEILHRYEMPCLHYRISADYGRIHHASSFGTDMEDIFGTPVNVASKINTLAQKDGFVIGGDLYQIAKSQTDYKLKQVKESIVILDKKYPVYQVV